MEIYKITISDNKGRSITYNNLYFDSIPTPDEFEKAFHENIISGYESYTRFNELVVFANDSLKNIPENTDYKFCEEMFYDKKFRFEFERFKVYSSK